LNRIMLAGEVVLTSLEATAHELINTGTAAASTAAGQVPLFLHWQVLTDDRHKFGAEAGHATALAGGAVRNVAVVYIDVRGIGRKALLKGTAKGFVKARLQNGETVVLQAEGEEVKGATSGGMQVVEAGQVEARPEGGYVVGMEEVGGKQHPITHGHAGSSGNEKDLTRR
jgi:spartin